MSKIEKIETGSVNMESCTDATSLSLNKVAGSETIQTEMSTSGTGGNNPPEHPIVGQYDGIDGQEQPKRPRGRPCKDKSQEPKVPKKRGRPKKDATVAIATAEATEEAITSNESTQNSQGLTEMVQDISGVSEPESTPNPTEEPVVTPSYNNGNPILVEPASNISFTKDTGLLRYKPASDDMVKDPDFQPPKMLFDEFWIEGEFTLFFGPTGSGKSNLMYQVADGITKGIPIPGVRMDAPPQLVLYIDMELKKWQFQKRYSIGYEDPYTFSKNLIRSNIDPNATVPSEFETFFDYFLFEIESCVKQIGVKKIIIDNLTFLKGVNCSLKNLQALLQKLNSMKEKYGLSILIIGHTNKKNYSRSITVDDLQGSKILTDLVDSAFVIGKSLKDEKVRYIKQVKVRSAEEQYGSDNVVRCRLDKPSNFLGFEFIGSGEESEHLSKPNKKDKNDLHDKVLALRAKGRSYREIESDLDGEISFMTVKRIIERYGNDETPDVTASVPPNTPIPTIDDITSNPDCNNDAVTETVTEMGNVNIEVKEDEIVPEIPVTSDVTTAAVTPSVTEEPGTTDVPETVPANSVTPSTTPEPGTADPISNKANPKLAA